MWVRGLKHIRALFRNGNLASHPMWVRGLKLLILLKKVLRSGRTLCGCVD